MVSKRHGRWKRGVWEYYPKHKTKTKKKELIASSAVRKRKLKTE